MKKSTPAPLTSTFIHSQQSMKSHDYSQELHDAMRALQLHDPMKEAREAMKVLQLQDPLKEYREAMKTIQLHDPMKEVRQAMKAFQFQDPLKEYREAMKTIQLHDPMKEVRQAMKAFQLQDPLKEYREAMKTIQLHDPMKEIREAIKGLQIQDPFKEYRESMKVTQSSMREISDGLKALGLEKILKTISQQEWPLAHATVDGGITVNADNTVTLDSTTLSCSEIQQIANEIADKTLNRSSERIEHVVATLVEEIRGLKNPPLEKFLSLLVYPIVVALIFSIVNPIADFYIKEFLSAEKREVEKKIKKHVLASTENNAALASYRLVSRNFLDVQANPSSKSPHLGRLYFGQVVMMIEKRKDWALVA